jgi:cbb3-type cytochrome oxidase maturation protein
MEILYLLIPLTILVVIVAIVAFLWTVRSGQYDDLVGPAHRILMDDDDPRVPRWAPGGDGRKGPDT